MSSAIISSHNLPWQISQNNEFHSKRKSLAQAAGGQQIGASLYQLEPGKKAFPYHAHTANEEAIFVLSGTGTLRYADTEHAIKEQDYIALPAGEAHAHQIINTSEELLTYLCLSTMNAPDVMFYPDSKKIGIMTGSAPGGIKNEKSYKAFFYQENSVDYFDGEK